MRAPWILPALVVLLLAGACQKPLTQSEAADRGLRTLKLLVEPRNARDLGFNSAADVQSARLDAPLVIEDIYLAPLKGYAPGQDPLTVLSKSAEIVYPVSFGGAVRSSIVVGPVRSGFGAVLYGDAATIQQFGRLKSTAPNAKDSLVRVPAMGLTFIRRDQGALISFVPLNTYPGTSLRVGRSAPATDVLRELAPIAATYTDAAS